MLAHIKEMIEINPAVKLQKGKSYPLIDIDKIIPGIRSVCSKELITYQGQSGCKFQNGDTLMARITPCLENGKIAQAKIDADAGIGSTELFVFRNRKDKTDGKWVYYFISSPYVRLSAINSMTGASGRQRADKFFIERLKFDFPDLPTQEKIASILSAYDDAIENNNKRIKILEKMAENLYREWFVRMRFPGHETAEYDNGLPKGWKRGRLDSFYKTTSGGTPSRSNNDFFLAGTIPWIKTGELRDTIILDTEEKITDLAVKKSAAKMIPANTLLMAMYGVNIGYLGITCMNSTCNQACCVFLDKQDISTLNYLFHYLKSIREYLFLIGFGAAQQNLSQDLIRKIKIIMPSEKLIRSFEQQQNIILKNIQNLLSRNRNLAQQRNQLLPRLISNKIVRGDTCE